MDDIYLVTEKNRARPAYDIVTQAIRQHAGIEANLGKTECWGKNGDVAPTGMNELNPDSLVNPVPIWKGNLENHYNGIEILGSPIGKPEYDAEVARKRILEEERY